MSSPSRHIPLDQKEFERLFKAHFQYLVNFACQYVPDQSAAQDICQKVFLRLWEKRANMDPTQSIKSYLFTAVRNRCLNYIRDHKKYRSQVLDLDCGEIDFAEQQEAPMATEELKARIDQALSSLPEKCRLVFEMSRYREMKYREIAEELQISPKTVEAHMSKAIRTLKEQLKDYLIVFIMILALWWIFHQ